MLAVAAVQATRGDRSVRLSVVRNGFHAVRLTDHLDPSVHSGYSIGRHEARALAAALIGGEPATVNTHDGRVLRFRGIRLFDVAFPERAWTLDEHQRPALGEALLAAAEG